MEIVSTKTRGMASNSLGTGLARFGKPKRTLTRTSTAPLQFSPAERLSLPGYTRTTTTHNHNAEEKPPNNPQRGDEEAHQAAICNRRCRVTRVSCQKPPFFLYRNVQTDLEPPDTQSTSTAEYVPEISLMKSTLRPPISGLVFRTED